MTDTFSPTKRSEIMSRVKSTGTAPERQLRRHLHSLGFRFRLHQKNLPGSPDLVLMRYRAIIFVHGCFWHSHDCKRAKIPEANFDYWKKKFLKNKIRDMRNLRTLVSDGWRVAVVWECSLKSKHFGSTLSFLSDWLKSMTVEFVSIGENECGMLETSQTLA